MKMNILGRRILAFGLVLVIITANLASVSFAEDSAPVQEVMVTVSETVSPEPTASVPVESAPAASAAPTQPTESVPVASVTPTQPTASAPVASVTPTQPTESAPVASVTPTQLTESTPVASEKPSQSTAAAPVASEVPIQPVTSDPVASAVPIQPTAATPVASAMPVKPSDSPESALPEVSPSASCENSQPEASPASNEDATNACTCGVEDGVHEASCAFYVPTFLDLLLSTETLKELHDAIMEDEETAKALTAEELLKVKEHAEKLFEDVQEPTKDEEEYLELILETIVHLQELLEENVKEEALELMSNSELLEHLLGIIDLEELYDTIVSEIDQLYGFSESELKAIEKHAEGLYDGINEENEKYKELLVVALAHCLSDGKIPLNAVPLTKELAKKKLESKYYFLTEDLKLTATEYSGYVYVPSGVNATIDLNGYALIGNKGKSVIYNDDGCLTIEDSRPNSEPHYFRYIENAAWELLEQYEANSIEVRGGIITGGYYSRSTSGGGGIRMGIQDFETTTIMNGGTIIGNHSNRAGGGSYGGVFVMNGGTIKGNHAKLMGGGVSVSGSFSMTGGYIGNNSIAPDSIHASGKENDKNFYDNPEITLGQNSSFVMTGGSIEGNISTTSSTTTPIPTTKISGGTIDGNFRILNKNSTTISGTGVLNGRLYMKSGNCTVKGNGIIENGKGENGGAVYLADGSFYMEGGAIRSSEAVNNGGAVYVANGTFTMTGGVVENNNAGNDGGAVYLQSGTLTMSGGTFANNTATRNGGAAFITGGNFNMNGGYLGEKNGANNAVLGGGVYVDGGAVTIEDGFVQYNAAENGGGAYLNGGTLTLNGGSFASNSATDRGGGAYITGGGFNLNGENASISQNTANFGGGIYLTEGQPNLLTGVLTGNTATADGGGIYIDKQIVNLKPTGSVSITGNSAARGAGIFIAGTEGKTEPDAGFSVDAESGGTVELSSNTATADGGGVCISNGYFALDADNIILHSNGAIKGGAVAVLSGNFTMSAGEIGASGKGNSADNGGGVYVSGGSVDVSGGTVQHNAANYGAGIYVQGGTVRISENGAILGNTASLSGGGICVSDGRIIMSGGRVTNNAAVSGEGGGMYVSSSGTNDVSVTVFSGEVAGNSAARNGGAVAVRGDQGNILVQIGVNEAHPSPFSHTSEGVTYIHASCPVISSNLAGISGGAFYISGNATTQLNLYCLKDSENKASGDKNALNENMSTFMMVEGGKVYLSTSQGYDGIAGVEKPGDGQDKFGDMTVLGTIHVVSGVLELFGTKNNPRLEDALTIDLTDESDFYYDHRTSSGKVTISYHENFHDAYGNIDSTQTAFDLDDKETHKIYSGLYAHEGYELYGWNTDSNAVADITPDGWYEVNAVYTFHALAEGESVYTEGMNRYGDLTVYAIWKANGYWVQFEAGVPENEEWYGEMEDMHCKYNVPQEYPQNRFVRPGYKFVGWKEPSGTVKQPGEELLNLTSKQEERVTVTAMWEKCEHPNDEATYSLNDTGDVMTKTCTLCGLTATAKLSAQDTVYNGEKHEAKLEIVCLEENFWNPQIQYSATPLAAQKPSKWVPEPIPEDKMCINAAAYTAEIKEGEKCIQVTYTIAKAEKPAPTSQPSYDPPTNGGNILKIYQIPVSQQKMSDEYEKANVEYIVRHYEGDKAVEEIVSWENKDSLEYELAPGLNVYSVFARYEETDNYLPSKTVSANFPFLFEDGFILYIKADIGILAEQGFNDTAKTIKLSLEDGYYLLDGDYKFEVREVQESDVSAEQWAQIKGYSDGHYYIECSFEDGILSVSTKNDDERDKDKTYIATLEIGITGKAPQIKNSKIKEKQHFSDFVGDLNPVISRDSAFTVYYEIKDFDDEHYQNPTLSFAQTIPSGTTIILRDRTDGSYWYFKAYTSLAEVPLDQFLSMGSNPQSYKAESKDLKLQFIVDFSRVQETINVDAFAVNLEICRKAGESEFVPETKSQTLIVGLGGVNISVSRRDQISSLVNAITITASANGGASKYDHRDLALVLEPTEGTELPIDASIRMNRDGVNSVWRQQNDRKIIISLGDFRNMSSDVKLELYSDMFPRQNEDVVYEIDASLYVSSSDADAAPLLGNLVDSVRLTFTNNLQETGISIQVDNDKRLFGVNDTIIKAEITTEPVVYTDNYYVKVELHKEFPDGSYGNTLIRPTVDNGTYTFDLNDCVDGDYCIVAFLTTKNDYVVSESRHYFIIDKTGD